MGAILKMRFTYSEIAKDNFSEALREKATQVWNNAISAYLQAVANIVAERQDTGMSLASLFPAIRDMQAKGGEINEPALNTRRDSAPWYMDMQGVTHRGQRKTAAFGERLGVAASTINYGTKEYPYYSFKFEIKVYQYLMNELGMFKLDAFKSMSAGQKAMENYLRLHGSEILPALKFYFKPVVMEIS